ncbi:MAG: hypothetical protein AAGC90_10655 [Curtobacterium sp.]
MAIGTGTSTTSRAATPQQLTATGSASTFPTFSADFTQRFTNALPNAVELRAPGAIGGGSVRVDFDPRMLGLSDDVAQLVADDEVTSTPVSVDGGSVTIAIPDQVSATHLVVVLPFFTSVRYPAENAGPSVAPTAHVTVGAQVADTVFPLDQALAQGLAWGAELDVAWRRQAVGGGDDYFAPGLVTLTSVGPGSVPAGTRIRVRTDSVLTEAVRPIPAPMIGTDAAVSSVEPGVPDPGTPVPEPDPSAAAPPTTITAAQADGARTTDIVLGDALAPGTTFTTALSGGDGTSRIRVKAVTFAQVTVDPPADARATQRVTGAETVTSLAPGGLPIATDMLTGSI